MEKTPSKENLNQKLTKFCSNMAEIERMATQFGNFYSNLMDAPDDASNFWTKLDANITCSYVNASIFWLYLSLKNTDLTDHPIKDEINRVRKYMMEYLIMKKDSPKLNLNMANNLIRNALWDPNQPEQSIPERSKNTNEPNTIQSKSKANNQQKRRGKPYNSTNQRQNKRMRK